MITDKEVKEYAGRAGWHTGQLAATRAILEALDRQGRLLPDRYRTATFRPGGDGLVSSMIVKLDGPMDIFRFAINMLNWQTQFGAAARHVLVELREHMTPDRFDPMARSLLGDRYERLRDRFERHWHCQGCDELIRVGAKYAPTSDAGAVCARCCCGIPEYAGQLVKRPNPVSGNPTVSPATEKPPARPPVVVLCGSTKFYDAFQKANYELTMAGKIVLSVGFYPHASDEHGHGEGVGHNSAEKATLDELHKRKIDMADEVFVLNVGGYIGESTRSEIDYALTHNKPVGYLE